MITGLDHVVALVRDIGAARAAYQTLLGRAPAWQNSGEGADRVLFTLDNMTHRIDGAERLQPRPRTACAHCSASSEGVLASLCFRVADMSKMHRRLERVALKPDGVAEVESSDAGERRDPALEADARRHGAHARRAHVLPRTG